MPTIFALILLGLVVVAIIYVTYFWKQSTSSRQPQKRSWITRVVCGGLGSVILLGLGWVTWIDATGTYTNSSDVSVPVPSKTPQPISRENQSTTGIPEDHSRFLVHSVLFDDIGKIMTPVDLRSFIVNFSADQPSPSVVSFRVPSISGDVKYEIDPPRSGPGKRFNMRVKYRFDSPSYVNSSEKHIEFQDRESVKTFRQSIEWFSREDVMDQVSLAPKIETPLKLILIVTRLHPDDPLKKTGIEGFRNQYQDVLNNKKSRGSQSESGAKNGDASPSHPDIQFHYGSKTNRVRGGGGFALAEHLGWGFVLLIISALLFSQLFVRRPLAFAGCLALVVLFSAACDYLVQTYHLSKLNSDESTVSRRAKAAHHVRSTFFFRDRARRNLESANVGSPSRNPGKRKSEEEENK